MHCLPSPWQQMNESWNSNANFSTPWQSRCEPSDACCSRYHTLCSAFHILAPAVIQNVMTTIWFFLHIHSPWWYTCIHSWPHSLLLVRPLPDKLLMVSYIQDLFHQQSVPDQGALLSRILFLHPFLWPENQKCICLKIICECKKSISHFHFHFAGK